jgi:PAS domain S-box-containing protein
VGQTAFSGWTVSGAVPGHPLASIQAIFPVRSLTAATIPGAGLHTTMAEGTTIVSSSARGVVGKTIVVPSSVAMIKAGRPGHATIYAPLIHTKVIEAYEPVPGTGFGVFFSVTTSVAYAAANHARRVLLAGYLVLLATGFWLAGGVFLALRRRDRARDVAAERYRSLAEASPDGVAIVDESGHLIYANPALVAMLGAGSPDTWHGHPMTEWINEPDGTAASERTLTVNPDDVVPDATMELRRADGHRVPVEGNAGPLDLGGRPGTIWVIRDLSRRQAAEAAVALAEVRQRATIEAITDGIVVFDLAGGKPPKPVLMNPAAKQFIGPPIDDPEGNFNWFDAHVTGPDGAPFDPQQRPVAVVARTGRASTAVVGLTPPGGEHRWVRVTANPIIDRLGTTVGIVNSLVDITKELADRVKADADRAHLADLVQAGIESEQALRESEERFHMAFEHAPIGKALISLDGHLEQANPALCRITGYSKEQLRHLTVADITHPDDLAAALAATNKFIANEVSTYTLEKRCLTATGAEIWVSMSMSLLRHEDGSPRHFIGLVQDITERKIHEEALAVERRRLHAAQTIGRIGSWEMELATGQVAWSDTLLELYGLDRPASPEDLPSIMVWIHPDDRQSVQTAIDDCGRTGEPMYVRHRVIRADDGRLRWLDAHGEGIYENGQLVRLAGAVVDVTEQVLTARAARDARDFAIEASRQKSAFLATMSHEIRTPMNAVIGMTGLLLDTPLDTNQRELVETVRTSGDALLGIINDILDFSKIEAGGLRLEQQSFDLSEGVGDALDLVSATPSAKGLELIGHIDERCATQVVGDVTRLRQVLVNLLSNAVKFTAHGEVVLSVEPPDVGDNGTADRVIALQIAVTDTGIGIPPDRMANLFESFSQVDTSTTRIYGAPASDWR